MSKLKGILLTEGMHGMLSQVEGLAKALDIDFIHEKIELNNFWKFVPPNLTPIQNFTFKNEIKKNFDIVISCGRKSVIPSAYLKKRFKKAIISIHIQDPKISIKNFDFVIVPEHDDLKGKNVLISKGAIHYLKDEELNQCKDYLKDKITKEKVVSFIVGGPNKYFEYNTKFLKNLFFKIENNFIKKGYQLIFIPSFRTPKNVIDIAKKYFDTNQIIIDSIDKKAYLSSLKLADHIVVTSDSTSMISEAAITGKPIYVAHMPIIRKNSRFNNFFRLFKSLNIIQDLENSVDTWSYKKLNETDRISKYIKQQIKNYEFS